MRASVVETTSTPQGETVVQDMAIEITPAQASSGSPSPTAGNGGGNASNNPAAASRSAGSGSPFTPEEELFRTKWGWKAFDDARTAARQAAQQ